MTTSRAVAEYFGKNHQHILRDIDALVEGGVSNFGLTPWRNLQNGQTYREYIMDRDGFTILAMGFTGAEALKFKLAYIAEFNRMEAELNARPQAPALDLRDPRALRTALLEYTEKVIELETKVEVLTPIAAVAEEHHNMGRWVSISKFARTLNGVNTNATKQDLKACGYLYQEPRGTYRVLTRVNRLQ